jgi:hypothetical protein
MLRCKDERGEILERWPGSIWGLIERGDSATVCLRFIDPYGDTVFNRYQIPSWCGNFRRLPRGSAVRNERDAIESLVAFLTIERDWVHTYVRFIGD